MAADRARRRFWPRLGRGVAFRERNPFVIGLAGLVVIALSLLAAFNAESLPFVGGGTTYHAAFTEAGGLKPDDEVRVAGVRVGKVTGVSLAGDHVRVDFRVSGHGVRLGEATGASVRIKTLLGAKYLALEPRGPGRLRPGAEIPRDRTVAAYDVVQAFSDLTTTTERIDTRQLARALDTVASTFRDSPQEVRGAVAGLSRLSRTVASRDAELRELLSHASTVSRVLSDRNQQLTTLLRDGDLLLREVAARRAVIHQLLVNTARLSAELTGLVRDNRAQVGPALSRLHSVLELLRSNQSSLDRSIALLAPFVRVFANTLGSGPWFDTYVQNLAPVPGGLTRRSR